MGNYSKTKHDNDPSWNKFLPRHWPVALLFRLFMESTNIEMYINSLPVKRTLNSFIPLHDFMSRLQVARAPWIG